MVFLGDLACPGEKVDDFISSVSKIPVFENETIVINLEGVIINDPAERKAASLYNAARIIDAFPQARKIVVCLANNHMYDYPEKIMATKAFLESNGVGTFGLVEDGLAKPYEFIDEQGVKNALFGHCWRLYTQTNINRTNSVRVVDQKYSVFVNNVSDYKAKNPDVKVYCFMHWNYDMEILPFPLLRSVARRLIDSGVEGVIGSHSHLPQGIELYKNKIIAYCLGNFYLPSGYFFDGTLTYPDKCKDTYGIRVSGKQIDCLWFRSDIETKGSVIKYTGEEQLNGKKITSLSRFANMTDTEYVSFFIKQRKNKILVPVFGKYRNELMCNLQETGAILRVKMIKTIQRLYKGNRA